MIFLFSLFLNNFCFRQHRYEFDDPDFIKIKNVFDEATEKFADGFTVSDIFPILTYLPFDLPDVRKIKDLFGVIIDMLREQMNEHQKTYKAGEYFWELYLRAISAFHFFLLFLVGWTGSLFIM